MPDDCREAMAAEIHDAWTLEISDLFSRCWHTPAGLVIPHLVAEQKRRLMATLYTQLPEEEKACRQRTADRLIRVFNHG